jgi:LysM repeat protein
VLRHYGADHFKTTTNELHFYKNGRPMSVDLIFNDDATRSVSLSQLNSVARQLKGQGVAEGLTEMDKSEPSAGRDTGPRSGPEREAKPITAKKATKDATDMLNRAVKDSHKKKDVKEGLVDKAAGVSLKMATPELLKMAGFIKAYIKAEAPDALPAMEEILQRLRFYSTQETGNYNIGALQNLHQLAMSIKSHLRPDSEVAPFLTEFIRIVKWYLDETIKLVNENNDPLMLKLRRAMVQEGRVKELADDLKTMSDADFMKKYGKAKAAIRKDMSRIDEKLTTSDPFAFPAAKASSGRAIDDPDIMGSLKGASEPKFDRFSKTSNEPKLDFRAGITGDDETEVEAEPQLAADPNPYMQSWGGKYATGGSSQPQWRYVEKGEDPARYGSDTISGTGTPDWRSIAAAGKPAAASGLPKMRFDRASNSLVPVDAPPALDLSPKTKDKLDRQTRSMKPADGSGANPNIDAATRDRARAWAAQQNAPGAALAGAMRSSGNPVDTEKKKADWKSIYNLNKSIIGDNPNSIKPGMKLKMPNGSTYSVQPGDTLSKIASNQINELSTNRLAQYKTAAAKDAKQADQEGDFKRGDKRFHGIVQATKKQFDNDAKKVDESRAARRALMARIVNSR